MWSQEEPANMGAWTYMAMELRELNLVGVCRRPSAAAAEAAAEAAGVDREKEFIRQGDFILDFLKSGKHLFLV